MCVFDKALSLQQGVQSIAYLEAPCAFQPSRYYFKQGLFTGIFSKC